MQPNLEEIQAALNKATGSVLEVSRGIAQWGQQRFRMPSAMEIKDITSKKRHGSMAMGGGSQEEAGNNIYQD